MQQIPCRSDAQDRLFHQLHQAAASDCAIDLLSGSIDLPNVWRAEAGGNWKALQRKLSKQHTGRSRHQNHSSHH